MTLIQLKYVIAVAGEYSLNDAAKKLYISQPSLSASIHSLEQEIGFDIFFRSKSGISLTPHGEEFLGYAKSVIEQYDVLEARYISHTDLKKKFSVSMQHYAFAVKAFTEVVKEYGMEEYEFEVHETRTHEVIENVRNNRSELGILCLNNYNRSVLSKIFRDGGLVFTPLFECGIYVYMWKHHPLAEQDKIRMEDLEAYPCLGFAQGDHNSFYYAEEVMSTHPYKQFIRASDRATMQNLMVGLNGYTLCSGIICEDLNGGEYCAVRLDTDETMMIGYITRKSMVLSEIGRKYLQEISKYKNYVLPI